VTGRAIAPVLASVIIILIGLGIVALVVLIDNPTNQTLIAQNQSQTNPFGIVGSNVETVTLSSATLYGGVTASASSAATSSLTISLNDPGSATTITSVSLTGAGITTATQWQTAAGAGTTTVNFGQAYTAGSPNAMGPDAVTSFTFYTWSAASQPILTGQTFNYVINFANGQSVSGSLIAQ